MTKFQMGDRARKISGSKWVGLVVGTYSTDQTAEGYAVESEAYEGSVQIYPATALEIVQAEPACSVCSVCNGFGKELTVYEGGIPCRACQPALAPAQDELWAVHAQGPDDLYAAFSREDAEQHAEALNALPMPAGIQVSAGVIASPWPAAEHWKYLAEQEREYATEVQIRAARPAQTEPSGYSAVDMASAAAQGFRDGQAGLVEALTDLLHWAEHQVCEHDSTHRGGAIWEICDNCGAKWADDQGGKPELKWPAAIERARAALAAQEAP